VVAFFVSSMGAVFLVLGAYSAPSPYSHLGANRELLALLAYEPVLFMVIMAVGINGSFLISEVPPGLLERIPLALVALLPVLVILLEKSPYDVPAAHQELATGPYVEYSGPYLALLELARWYQLAFVYGIATLFIWGPGPAGDVALKLLLAFALLFAAILIDNTTARLTRRRMVLFTLTAGVGLIALNLIVLYLAGVI
jgi:ech hydrogenase subunit B